MARVAMDGWEDQIEKLRIEPYAGIGFNFTSGRTSYTYQTKSICWSLLGVFTAFNIKEAWVESSWISKLIPNILGVGTIYLDLTSPDEQSKEHSSQDRLWEASNSTASSAIDRPSIRSKLGVSSIGSLKTGINFPPLDLGLSWRISGETFSTMHIYAAAMFAILEAGPLDATEGNAGVSRYDARQNFTLAVFPKSSGSGEDLKWWMVLEALWMVARAMSKVGTRGTWAELKGVLKVRGVHVGKLILIKGRVLHPQLGSAFDEGEWMATFTEDNSLT